MVVSFAELVGVPLSKGVPNGLYFCGSSMSKLSSGCLWLWIQKKQGSHKVVPSLSFIAFAIVACL